MKASGGCFRGQVGPKLAPSLAQEGAQSAQRQLKTVPGAAQGGVKFACRAVLAVIWRLRGVQEPSETSRRLFWTLRGTILRLLGTISGPVPPS